MVLAQQNRTEQNSIPQMNFSFFLNPYVFSLAKAEIVM